MSWRPPQARREKPRVSAFTSADIPKILALEPDLVLRSPICRPTSFAELIRRGIAVHAFNQRTIAGVFDMIRMVGAMVGAAERAGHLADDLAERLAEVCARGRNLSRRPKVFFRRVGRAADQRYRLGIGAGRGRRRIDIFADHAASPAAKDRIVTAAEIVARRPDIIIGSWCGKKIPPRTGRARPGFADVPAVLDDAIYEMKSPLILQPGPAALTDGLAALQQIIERWARGARLNRGHRSCRRGRIFSVNRPKVLWLSGAASR